MARKCSVRGCRTGYSKNNTKFTIYSFPLNNPALKQKWAEQVGKKSEEVTKHMGVCALHFPSNVEGKASGSFFIPTEPPSLFLDLRDTAVTDKRRAEYKPPEENKTKDANEVLVGEVEREHFVLNSDIKASQRSQIKHYPETCYEKEEYETSSRRLKSESSHSQLNHLCNSKQNVLSSLVNAIQAVFLKLIDFNYVLKVEGCIILYVDEEEKIEYVLDEQFTLSERESLVTNQKQGESNGDMKVEKSIHGSKEPRNTKKHKVMKIDAESFPISDEEEVFIKSEPFANEDSDFNFTINKNTNVEQLFYNRPHTYDVINDRIHAYGHENKQNDIKLMGEHRYKCEVCGKFFTTPSHFTSHVKIYHADYKPYKCSFCDETFVEKQLHKQHEKKHTLGTKPFQCDNCGFRYAEERSLKLHMLSHKPNSEWPFKCEVCGLPFRKKTRFNRHMRKHNGVFYQCQFCGKEYYDLGSYNQHTRVHTGEKPYVCKMCAAGFRSYKQLLFHERNRHPNVERADAEFNELNELDHSEGHFAKLKDNRLAKHTLGMKHKCDLCGLHFKTLKSIKLHMIVKHLREKTYYCDKCGDIFNRYSDFRYHKLKHLGQKFTCETCGKTFNSSSHLKRHSIKHSGLKFSCRICGAQYTQKYNLKVHERVHTGDLFSCDMCGKGFVEKRLLAKHQIRCSTVC